MKINKLIFLFFILLTLSFLIDLKPSLAQVVNNIISSDGFEGGLGGWSMTSNPNNHVIVEQGGYNVNDWCLNLDYQASDPYLQIDKTLSQSYTNVVARVFFWDDPNNTSGYEIANTGSLFEAVSSDGQSYTDIGIIGPGNYYVRINSSWVDSHMVRTKGWHMYEIIVTDSGTYAKLDNEFILDGYCNGNLHPIKNTSQKDLKTISFISSWGKYGRAYYDEFVIAQGANADALTGNLAVTRDFYNLYKDTNFSSIYPELGVARAYADSNDSRSLFSTAFGFYTYGKQSGDYTAIARGLQLYKDGLNNTKWNNLNNGFRGMTMGNFSEATYAMQKDLDVGTKAQAKQIIYDQVKTYYLDQNKQPTSGYSGDTQAETNALDAFFLAEAANYFPDIPNRSQVEAKARCFAYHSITNYPDTYCSITTQTVYGDFRLQNHGIDHPDYAIAAIHLLGLGALSYEKTGKAIPSEFQHNVANLYNNFIALRMDLPSFYPTNNVSLDWKGAHKSLYWAFAIEYAKKAGENVNFSLDYMMQQRSIFYYQIPATYHHYGPSSIGNYTNPNYPRCTNSGFLAEDNPAGDWFLDSMHGGEFAASYVFSKQASLPAVCMLSNCSNYSGLCGTFSDGCGNNISCGCPSGQTCNVSGQCSDTTPPAVPTGLSVL